MPKTLQELRTARETAGQAVVALGKESEAEGFTSTPEWDAKWKTANDDYNAAVGAENTELSRLERAETAARVAAEAERLNARGRNALRPDHVPTDPRDTNPRVPARARRHGALRAFKGEGAVDRAENAGLWAAAALFGNARAAAECQRRGIEIVRGSFDSAPSAPGAVLSTGNNTSAGYFVPNEIEYTIHELALAYGIFRQYAEIVSMGSDTRESPRWTASMTAYWTGEGQKPTSSDPAWDMIKLVAKDLKAMTKMTRNLDEDSAVDLGDKITMCLAEAFTYAEDNAGFNGDATSTYGGILGLITKILAASASFHTAATGNVSDITLDTDDFNACVAKLPNWPNFSPVWFMHKTVWANSCQRLQMALGGVVPADLQAGAKPMWLGYPVVFVNAMDPTPTVSEIAAILGDLRWSSKVGDRRGRTVETGFENDDFTKGLVTILGTQRVDINNHTITDPRDSTKVGPLIGLKLAAS